MAWLCTRTRDSRNSAHIPFPLIDTSAKSPYRAMAHRRSKPPRYPEGKRATISAVGPRDRSFTSCPSPGRSGCWRQRHAEMDVSSIFVAGPPQKDRSFRKEGTAKRMPGRSGSIMASPRETMNILFCSSMDGFYHRAHRGRR